MIPTIIVPESREHWLSLRTLNLNSTEVGPLFGIEKYATIYELWHYKNKSIQSDFTGNERTEWGLALQDSIAAKVANDNGWMIRRMDEYMFLPEIRLGSSFDFCGIDLNRFCPSCKEKTIHSVAVVKGAEGASHDVIKCKCGHITDLGIEMIDGFILEIKNVDKFIFLDEWTKREDGTYEAPLHIEIQVQTQLAVSDRRYCVLVALVGGNEAVIIRRDRDEAVISTIIEKTKWFWQTIADKKEPEPDFKKDAEFIAKLYGYAEPEKVIEAGEDIKALAVEYKAVSDQIKPLEEKKESLKAEMLTLLKDAEKCTGEGFTISAGMVGECPISYVRKAYRTFKLNWKKEKKDGK
jgi:predicted phage-related endonuclease